MNLKIVTVVGARPQFIKAAVVSRELRKRHEEILVHTGQHYDHNMSQVFFDELCIAEPDCNLGIAGGSHAAMTGHMMVELEGVLKQLSPDVLLVYGDTNSTMAAALAAVKIHIPVVHVESGGRSGSLKNPEEVNRIVTDHVSTLTLACTPSALENLRNEGLGFSSHFVGDPMYDAFLQYSDQCKNDISRELRDIDGVVTALPDTYHYLTCHRQENTKDPATLITILNAMESLAIPTIYPVHPRNRMIVREISSTYDYEFVTFVEPVSYIESISLVKHAKHVVTDSGGVQREAFFAGVPCVTIFDYVVWPETMAGSWNVLAKADHCDLVEKISRPLTGEPDRSSFGNGDSASKIVKKIESLGFK